MKRPQVIIQMIKDKINPPKRCTYKYSGKGSFVGIPCRFYECKVCGSMVWDTREGKNKNIMAEFESHSRCIKEVK